MAVGSRALGVGRVMTFQEVASRLEFNEQIAGERIQVRRGVRG